ncbi:MAG: glycosyltransferase family 4 protein [Bacteroidetes bacterium]|nr:glycosyltransferase family 4 protein [Bacteroidota bacterium]
MNITIYTAADFPSGGAAENYIRQMALGLLENGVRINVIRTRGRMYFGENYTGVPCSNFLFSRRPKNELLKFFEMSIISLFIPFSVLINKIKFKTDVIILDGVDYAYYSIPFVFTALLLNVKTIRILGDYYETKTLSPVWWKFPKVIFYKLQFQLIDQLFNGIIVFSEFLKKEAETHGVKENNIILIPHFIDVKWFAIDKAKRISTNDKITIGYCGTANVANGIIDLIDAFKTIHKKFENSELLIIGQPTKEILSSIKETISFSPKLSICITGHISKQLVKDKLNSCEILVNPRRSGRFAEAGFPTKLGEYFSVKKAVVSTLTGDVKMYFIDKNELVIAAPNNPESLAQGITYLINNPEDAERIANNGYHWAVENLDYISNSKKLLNFLVRIIN